MGDRGVAGAVCGADRVVVRRWCTDDGELDGDDGLVLLESFGSETCAHARR